MPDDLARIAVLGVIGSLLAFELVAAIRSWYEASTGRDGEPGSDRRQATFQPILLSQAFAIRDHFAQRRPQMNEMRSRYAVLRTGGYGRQLRAAIGHVQPRSFRELAAICPACRPARLKGQVHCPECRRRLLVPVMPTGA